MIMAHLPSDEVQYAYAAARDLGELGFEFDDSDNNNRVFKAW